MLLTNKIILICFLTTININSWGDSLKINQNNTNNIGYSLRVKVEHLRNLQGVVQFSLYNKDGTIPDENYKKTYKQLFGKIKNGVSIVTFSNLPRGRYAINILHDENKNKKIDKGFIFPIEGVGFSNYKSIGLSNRPNFSKASFILNANTEKQVSIIYF
jgi:uncharacterized protein (DUF2141 family)